MQEIGGFFEYPEFDCENKNDSVYHYLTDVPQNYVFMRDGRQAIKAVLQNIPDLENKICYLPAYLCHSILQPFKELELNVKFYGMVPMVGDSIVFIIDYFGTESVISNKAIDMLLDKGNMVIMDITHSIFSKTRFESQHKDYYLIASIRKVFPIPDGGIVYHSNSEFLVKTFPPSGHGKNIDAMKLKALNKGSSPIAKSNYRELYNNYETEKDELVILQQKIPGISKQILKKLNISNIIKRRATNLDFLYENINKKWIFLYESREDIKSPFFLPLLFKTQKQRNDVKAQLIKEEIYPPIHWELPKEVPERFFYEYSLSDRILSLPIDQRYEEKDMQRIAKILNEVM